MFTEVRFTHVRHGYVLEGVHSLIVNDLGGTLEWQKNPNSITAAELIKSIKYSLIFIQISLTSFSAL